MSGKKKKSYPPPKEIRMVETAIRPDKNLFIAWFEKRTNQLWIIGLMSFLLYGNTLFNQYALDDGMVLTDNKFVQKGISGIPDIVSHDSFYGSIGDSKNLTGGRYRPLSLIMYAIEVSFFGNNAAAHHFFNILFYALTSIVLLLLTRKFIFPKSPGAAFAATLLFVVHPVHTEVIANIKSRDEIFSLLFLLLTLYYLLDYYVNEKVLKKLVVAILFYALALLSKENGLTFLAIIPATIFFFGRKKIKDIISTTLPFAAVAAIYILARIALIGLKNNQVAEVMDNPYVLASVSQKFATITFVFFKYLQLLFWPHPLSYDYSYNQIAYKNFGDPAVIASIIILAGMIVYAFIAIRKKDIIGWCIIFYLGSIFIVSNVLFNIGAPMAERFLFQASVPFVIFVVEIIRRLFIRLKLEQSQVTVAAVAMLLPILLLSGYATVARNQDWKSDQVLFLHDVKISSSSARANTYAGVALIRLSDQSQDAAEKKSYAKQSLDYFKKSLAVKNDYITTLLNMGVAYSRMDSLPQAEAAWKRARMVDSTDKNLQRYENYLAQTYYQKGIADGVNKDYALAISHLEKSVSYGASNADAWYNLGGAYFSIQNYTKAKICWEKTLQLNPQQKQAMQGVAAIKQMGI
jgi:cytochrome c-type biogenesis protein CcmH/NrfG